MQGLQLLHDPRPFPSTPGRAVFAVKLQNQRNLTTRVDPHGCICKEHASITSVKPFSLLTSTRIQKSKTRRHHGRATTLSMRNTSASTRPLTRELVEEVPRRNIIASLVSSFIFSQLGSHEVTLAEPSIGFREHIDIFDGYSFYYPKNWIQVKGAGADIFFRDPFVLDENVSVEVSSPSSSRYKSVEDLGPPQAAAEKVLKQYLTEFMSTRLGVRRESNILTTSSRVADDGKLYYQVEVNIKSYANNNELAVMPQDRIPRLEWDRRYLSVLGVGNNRLYELRLQTPENVFVEEEKELRQVMDSFRVLESVN